MSALSVRRSARLALAGVSFALVLGVVATATNAVPQTKADTKQDPRATANQLKPPECAALNLTGIRIGSGSFSDDNASHLVLGSPGTDVIRGSGGTTAYSAAEASTSCRRCRDRRLHRGTGTRLLPRLRDPVPVDSAPGQWRMAAWCVRSSRST